VQAPVLVLQQVPMGCGQGLGSHTVPVLVQVPEQED
jgi:hypothetical protein